MKLLLGNYTFMFIGPPCPSCGKPTSFLGVEPSWYGNKWVEAYTCPIHNHRFEGPVKVNKNDDDYKKPPFNDGSNTANV